MEVFYDLNNLPKFRNAVITIGSFDGVHSGHQKIIEKINHLAQSIGGESVVITFHPHPRLIIYPRDTSLELLTSVGEKVQLFEKYGADKVVVVPFTIAFSQLSADEYIQKFLIEKFNPKYIVIGYDHRFGLNRQGDINYLRHYGDQAGYEVIEIAKQEIEDIAVSSTKIRRALGQGDVKGAQRLLGHPFMLTGKVVHGQKIGTSLGFPTANLELGEKHKLVPPNGIYAVRVYHEEEAYGGMLYIGDRPTLKAYNNRTIEVNIFDFDRDIYGDQLQLELISYLRSDVNFGDLNQLKAELAKDRERARAALALDKSDDAIKKNSRQAAVAVVVLNFNGRDYLEKFLPGVLQSTYDHLLVYVADNGSTDGSLEYLATAFPEVKRIDLQRNHGFAEGYNLALQQVDSNYYILLNSDVNVSPGWIEPVIRAMEKDRNIAACQPKIKAFHQPAYFEYAGAAGGWMDYLGYPFCRGRIFSVTEEDSGQYDRQSEIFWASGAALFIRAQLFHRIGGFDPDYFAHAEEIDLCWRLQLAGYKIIAVPESVVYHVGGGTLTYNTPRKTYLNFRNTLFTIFKNEPFEKLLWLIPLRLLLDGLAALLFLSQGKFRHITSIARANWSFFSMLPKLRRKRTYYHTLIVRLQNGHPPRLQGRFEGSIIWEYYVLGKRRFEDLF